MSSELTLRDYVEILRRRAWIVGLCFLSALILGLLWSALQTPLYRSEARVLINQVTTTESFDPAAGTTTNATFADRQVATAVELIESQLVDEAAEAELGFEANISASAVARADIVVLRATNADPVRAQRIAQTYADIYLEIRRTEFTEERLATAEELSIKIAELNADIAAMGDDEDATRAETLRDDLADRYDRLIISAGLGNNGSARITDRAQVPEKPFSPRTNRNMVLGGVLGLMLGAGAALLVESLDNSIKSRQVIESLTPGLPALASIPAMKSSEHRVIAAERPDGLETEVFRTLRASIEFASVDKPIKVIQITSAGASAGKTTVAANLAVVMAQSGQRVAVVDCDLRRPWLHTLFGIEQVPGISSVIIGRSTGNDASHSLNLKNGRLRVFPSGPIPPGPSELLGSERARSVFAGLRKSLDVVIIDSPPVLPVSDALVLSRMVDATVVVANAKTTKRDDLTRALEQLEHAGATVIGTVLNGVKANANHGYGYGYGYGYGDSYGAGKRNGLFGRSSGDAPRLEGTEVLDSADLPRFEAARPADVAPATKAAESGSPFADAVASPSWLSATQDRDSSVPAEPPSEQAGTSAAESRSEKRRQKAVAQKASAIADDNAGETDPAEPVTVEDEIEALQHDLAALREDEALDPAELDAWSDEIEVK